MKRLFVIFGISSGRPIIVYDTIHGNNILNFLSKIEINLIGTPDTNSDMIICDINRSTYKKYIDPLVFDETNTRLLFVAKKNKNIHQILMNIYTHYEYLAI